MWEWLMERQWERQEPQEHLFEFRDDNKKTHIKWSEQNESAQTRAKQVCENIPTRECKRQKLASAICKLSSEA